MVRIFLIGLFFSSVLSLSAQIRSYEEQIRTELLTRGVKESELTDALLAKGIQLTNPSSLGPAEILIIQQTLDELVKAKSELLAQSRDETLQTNDTIPLKGNELNILKEPLVDSLDEEPELQIFGFHLFADKEFKALEAGDGFVAPLNYIIGSGDILAISIFGQSRMDENFLVEDDGAIRIRDRAIKIHISGLSLAQARLKLVSNFKNYYRFTDNQFNLSLSSVRQMRIQIFGEVKNPGDYIFSGLNNIVNALKIAGGLAPNASVRNIQLVKQNGLSLNFDLYQLLTNPDFKNEYVLENGDFLFVPASGKIVEIKGAVRRPMRYELKENDGLLELIRFAGGLDPNAYLTTMRLTRYDESRRIVKTIPYAVLIKDRANFELEHGDDIEISRIDEILENYISVNGEVRNAGNFELTRDLTLAALLQLAGIKPSSKLDFAFLKRNNRDGSTNWIPLNLEDVLNNTGPSSLVSLQDRDELIIWPMERFSDNQFVSISGAVRYPEKISFDRSGSLKISDIIRMAGGLQRDAANFAHVHRLDPLNPSKFSYVRIDLDQVFSDPNAADDLYVEPYDSIYIYSKTEFLDELYVKISGAVNNPGEFAYGEGMSLSDLIILAGGFRRSSATNDIEVSRVIIQDNLPTKTIVERVTIDRANYLTDNSQGAYKLEPYDNVFVRFVPEFELQQNVLIQGEITFPGEYSLISENESVTMLIGRAGGLTEESFPEGATLYRSEDSLGYIIMRMDEALKDPSSRYNYSLKNGDIINIPKKIGYVTIVGSTQYLIQNNLKQINVPFIEGKDANYYINTFAGGFSDDARTDKLYVKYANGEVKTSEKRFLFGKKHPEVLPGSEIQVGKAKPITDDGKEEQNVNWTKVLGDSVAQAMSILTLILLIQRLD